MPWVDIDDVTEHLNKSIGATDLSELTKFIPAACGIVEDLKGRVDVVTVDQDVASTSVYMRRPGVGYGGYTAAHRWVHVADLLETPVLAVDAVQQVVGGTLTAVPPADPSVPGSGWSLTDSLLTVPVSGRYVVTYRAGRDPVPANFRLAALELVAHLWRGSQLNQSQGSGRSQRGDQMQVVPHMASALPYRVRELLGIYGAVVNDHVVIG